MVKLIQNMHQTWGGGGGYNYRGIARCFAVGGGRRVIYRVKVFGTSTNRPQVAQGGGCRRGAAQNLIFIILGSQLVHTATNFSPNVQLTEIATLYMYHIVLGN